MSNKKKYKRRKYGLDTIIYTTQEGNFLTLDHQQFADTFSLAGQIIDILNNHSL